MVVLNGKEFDIDFTDAEVNEKIDAQTKIVDEKVEEIEKNINNIELAEGIKQACKILKDFLDYVLGEGSSEKIFEGKNSLKLCMEVYRDLINERNRQFENLQKVVDQYSPDRLNR